MGDLAPQLQEGPAGIGPCRWASVQSSVPAAEEELHNLHGAVDSSERWLWVCIAVAITSPMEKTQVWTHFCLCRWKGWVWGASVLVPGREQRLFHELVAHAPPWEQVLKAGQHGSLLFGNMLGYGSSLTLFCEPSREGKGRSL